jgi:diadenosine tetraphosphate (Ap4A) HIT family hydrolase
MNRNVVDVKNAGLVQRGDYAAVLEEIDGEGQCPFCRDRLLRHHPNPILWETANWVVTTNAWPYKGSRLHFLLIATNHVERIEELSAEAWQEFFEHYGRLVKEYALDGASILWRTGSTAITGASVAHLHAQIVIGHPRTEDAEVITGLLGFRNP